MNYLASFLAVEKMLRALSMEAELMRKEKVFGRDLERDLMLKDIADACTDAANDIAIKGKK